MAGRGTGDGHSPEDRSPSSLSAVGGPDWLLPGVDDGDEATDYRRRCMLLEASLVKFKEKATRVRQLFTVKMHDMENQIAIANRRVTEAETRCEELEAQHGVMAAAACAVENGQVHQSDGSSIDQLRAQLQEQHELRFMEAKLVAEKSAKIREWVSHKVQEMENQNRDLADENSCLREEVERLRTVLNQYLSESALGKNEEVNSMTAVNNHHSDKTGLSLSAVSAAETALPLCAPRIRIERKLFPHVSDQPSFSTTSSTATSDSRDFSDPLHTEQLQQEMGNSKRTSFGGRASATASSTDDQTSVQLTPKEAPSPLTPFLPDVPPNSPHLEGSHTDSAAFSVTLPRCKKDTHKFFAGSDQTCTFGCYGPTMTIDRKCKTHPRPVPPVPPVRRLPSWESRIYSMISDGLQISHSSATDKDGQSGVDTLSAASGFHGMQKSSFGSSANCTMPVPVYTVLKGHAFQIRQSPFSDDSCSDSSDIDQPNGLVPSLSSRDNRMSERNTNSRRPAAAHKSTANRSVSREGSCSSLASETSSDYAFPPEDGASVKTDNSDMCLATSAAKSATAASLDSYKKNTICDKCGYLMKLGGKQKLWRRWWFVLNNGELTYCKSQKDTVRKPRGCISLSASTRLKKMPNSTLFELWTARRVYYFAAENVDTVDRWVKVLRRSVRTLTSEWTAQHGIHMAKDVVSGWIIKVKNGRRKRCWCSLHGKLLIFRRNANDQSSTEQINMVNSRVEEVDRSCDSDVDSSEEDGNTEKYTLAVWPASDCPTYLLLSSRQNKDTWLYHLIVASAGGRGAAGTGSRAASVSDYEQLVLNLMSVDADSTSPYWNDACLLHIKDPSLSRPLTTLHSDELQKKALDMFKLVCSFMWTVVDNSASCQLDGHVSQAQTLLSFVLHHPELCTELFCQLIKQTSKHPLQPKSAGMQHFLLCGSHSWFNCDSSPTSPTSSGVDLPESKLNPPGYVLVQGWQLLTLAVSLFVPRHSVLWFLKVHLQRNVDSRTEMGKYAIFCQYALERTVQNGPRRCRPSRMEVLSILLHNPYYHSQPISIPVHLMNGSYQVVSFDGSTTVSEFLVALEKSIGVRESSLSGFALFSDDPKVPGVERCLQANAKLCDVISKWEQEYTEHSGSRSDLTRTIRLLYKSRFYFSRRCRSEKEKERLLLVYQTNGEIVARRFPVTQCLALELAALMAQMEYGDLKSAAESTSSGLLLRQALDNFYPSCYRISSVDCTSKLEQEFADSWSLLRGRGSVDCVRVYLTVVRKWSYFGARMFAARLQNANASCSDVWLVIHEDGVAILDQQTMVTFSVYDYSSVITFGGYQDGFLLVVCSTGCDRRHADGSENLLFSMSKPNVAEAADVIAGYINAQDITDTLASAGNRKRSSYRHHSSIPSAP